MAMHKAKLILKKADTRQAAIDALTPLADSLKRLDAEPSEWDRRLVADLHTLHSVGIHTVESMLCHNRTSVLPHMALMSIIGRRKVKSKHYAAWRRVAHYLITGLPWRETCNAPPDQKDRPLHREFRENLKAHWPDNHTMWHKATPGTHTRICMLCQACTMTWNTELYKHETLQTNTYIDTNKQAVRPARATGTR
jgi:hypothetical protein